MKQPFILLLLSFLSWGLLAQAYEKGNTVRIHSLSDVQHLNFMTASNNIGTLCGYLTHTYLYQSHPYKDEFIPYLVEEKAERKMIDKKVHLTFKIRDEARWDNGDDITGADVVFSLKIIFTPNMGVLSRLTPLLDYIEDIIVDDEDPKQFTVVCRRPYMLAETSIASNVLIMPKHIYDEEKILDGFELKTLLSQDEEVQKELVENERLEEFRNLFNSGFLKQETTNGAGPYEFEQWIPKKSISFTRKKDWWGDKVQKNRNILFDAFPERIEYVINPYPLDALKMFEEGEIDVMSDVPHASFFALREEQPDAFHYYWPEQHIYDYIGMNMTHPILKNHSVRNALNHLVDTDSIIQNEMYGFGEKRKTIFANKRKNFIHPDLEQQVFDIEKANKILDESGWIDTDKNGIRDKIIDGKKEELYLMIYCNSGNHRRLSFARSLKINAKKAGIKIIPRIIKWSEFINKIKKKDFELYISGWSGTLMESDPTQIWHTKSIDSGSNFTSFGNENSDRVIERLRSEVDVEKRIPLYHQLEMHIDESRPYIFLAGMRNRVIISKKFKAMQESTMRSGFFSQHLSLAD